MAILSRPVFWWSLMGLSAIIWFTQSAGIHNPIVGVLWVAVMASMLIGKLLLLLCAALPSIGFLILLLAIARL